MKRMKRPRKEKKKKERVGLKQRGNRGFGVAKGTRTRNPGKKLRGGVSGVRTVIRKEKLSGKQVKRGRKKQEIEKENPEKRESGKRST